MRAPLHLTRPDSHRCVSVPAEITEHLLSYQIEAVRFIYGCYRRNVGVALNTEAGMNEPLAVCAFLAAVRPFPVLLLCPDSEITRWQYECETRAGFQVKILSNASDTDWETQQVVLLPHSLVKRADCLRQSRGRSRWPLLVVDGIEEVVDMPRIKNSAPKFCIGITRHNFVHYPNLALRKQIYKWIGCSAPSALTSRMLSSEQWLKLNWHQYPHEKASDSNSVHIPSQNL